MKRWLSFEEVLADLGLTEDDLDVCLCEDDGWEPHVHCARHVPCCHCGCPHPPSA